MVKNIVIIRILAILINVFVLINTLGILALAIYKTARAFIDLFEFIATGSGNHSGLQFLEAIDVLLISLVFLVFSVGINILFIKHADEKIVSSIPKWMRVKNFSELKLLLMEAIIATLFVFLISAFVRQDDEIQWVLLALPLTILLLALSLRILRENNRAQNDQ